MCVLEAALLFCSTPYATAEHKPSAAELAAITARGRMLAAYDTAAWQATDAVMATHPKAAPSGRYIAHLTEAGWVVDFGHLNAAGDKFLVSAEATQVVGPTHFDVKSFDPAREDSGWNLSAARGIETASKNFGQADRPYNIAVLPKSSGGLYVYLYPAGCPTHPFFSDEWVLEAVHPSVGSPPPCHPFRESRLRSFLQCRFLSRTATLRKLH